MLRTRSYSIFIRRPSLVFGGGRRTKTVVCRAARPSIHATAKPATNVPPAPVFLSCGRGRVWFFASRRHCFSLHARAEAPAKPNGCEKPGSSKSESIRPKLLGVGLSTVASVLARGQQRSQRWQPHRRCIHQQQYAEELQFVVQVSGGIFRVPIPDAKPDAPRGEGNRKTEGGEFEPAPADARDGLRGNVRKGPNEWHAQQRSGNEQGCDVDAAGVLSQVNAKYGERECQIVNG